MMIEFAKQMRGAAVLMLDPGYAIDKFLDWIDDLSGALVPVQNDGLVFREVRARAGPEPFNP